eukprot:TRINITY_DN13477_c0_g2_i1.p1 TRINITY_DN13477_c0_g2~~TRINITY_DN13477_c0_g2_i1.p1  ORF type:complete len:686 (+),score=152.33 TRINITY_DN13477_c0_g2_i1:29-2059(+)
MLPAAIPVCVTCQPQGPSAARQGAVPAVYQQATSGSRDIALAPRHAAEVLAVALAVAARTARSRSCATRRLMKIARLSEGVTQQQTGLVGEATGEEGPELAPVADDSGERAEMEEGPELAPVADDNAERAETEAFLTEEVGLSGKQLQKVVNFWSYSGDRTPPLMRCRMVVDFLRGEEVGLDSDQLKRTIAECPEVLEVFSVETLKDKVRFLMIEVAVSDVELPAIIGAYPQVFARSLLTTLRPALEFWLGTVKMDLEELKGLLLKIPTQLWVRSEVLRPKWRFATEVMGISKQQAIDTNFFSMSLERTIAPRHFFVLEKGLSGVPLKAITGGGDAAFCKTLEVPRSEYKDWLQEWPFSEQARTVAWIKKPKRSRASGNFSGGKQPRSSSKWRGNDDRRASRRWSRGSRDRQGGSRGRGGRRDNDWSRDEPSWGRADDEDDDVFELSDPEGRTDRQDRRGAPVRLQDDDWGRDEPSWGRDDDEESQAFDRSSVAGSRSRQERRGSRGRWQDEDNDQRRDERSWGRDDGESEAFDYSSVGGSRSSQERRGGRGGRRDDLGQDEPSWGRRDEEESQGFQRSSDGGWRDRQDRRGGRGRRQDNDWGRDKRRSGRGNERDGDAFERSAGRGSQGRQGRIQDQRKRRDDGRKRDESSRNRYEDAKGNAFELLAVGGSQLRK